MKRPSLIEDRVLLLPPRLLGSVDYYRLAARFRYVVVDPDVKYNKREKEVHRFDIVDTRGLLKLTVPVVKVEGANKARWSDVRVSSHGQWWASLMTSLESAYGRTPFFEFYADRFAPFFNPRPAEGGEPITVLDSRLHELVCDILGLNRPITMDDATKLDLPLVDYRREPLPTSSPVGPYYQVRADRLGFVPGLSIVDLIFNTGTEAPLFLAESVYGM